jgi:hypothetical protein
MNKRLDEVLFHFLVNSFFLPNSYLPQATPRAGNTTVAFKGVPGTEFSRRNTSTHSEIWHRSHVRSVSTFLHVQHPTGVQGEQYMPVSPPEEPGLMPVSPLGPFSLAQDENGTTATEAQGKASTYMPFLRTRKNKFPISAHNWASESKECTYVGGAHAFRFAQQVFTPAATSEKSGGRVRYAMQANLQDFSAPAALYSTAFLSFDGWQASLNFLANKSSRRNGWNGWRTI